MGITLVGFALFHYLDKMPPETISQKQLTQQLFELGVTPGGVLLVHCAFSRVRPVENGAHGLISALQHALGPDGTLVMSSMSDDAKASLGSLY